MQDSLYQAGTFSFAVYHLKYGEYMKKYLFALLTAIFLTILMLFPKKSLAACVERSPHACTKIHCAVNNTSYCCDTANECSNFQLGKPKIICSGQKG